MGKATKGSFYSNGRRKQPTTKAAREAKAEEAKRVAPTDETRDYIERRLAAWTVPGLWTTAAAEQCYDNAGILWATGWFDKHGFPPEEIRDIFRRYAALYWRWYQGTAPKISKGERTGKSEPGIHAEGWERLFQRLDARLPIGSPERKAVHELAVDGWHFDGYHHRAEALANLGRVRLNARRKEQVPVAGRVAHETGKDMDWLEAALRGAFAMLDAETAKHLKRGWDIPLWAMNDPNPQSDAA